MFAHKNAKIILLIRKYFNMQIHVHVCFCAHEEKCLYKQPISEKMPSVVLFKILFRLPV